jgi:hypothetical protein
MSKLSREEIFETADRIYFEFMNYIDDSTESEFIENDPDNPKGTRNTKKGQELFDTIEFYLESII